MRGYKVIDLFAGPGGLGEGFSSFDEGRRFQIVISAEMDAAACRTLALRSWFRHATRDGSRSRIARYYAYCNQTDAPSPVDDADDSLSRRVAAECLQLELGTRKGNREIDGAIKRAKLGEGETVVIGGPPCQAYSLAGRARNRGIPDYIPEEDGRHYLYKQYLRIIAKIRPVAFIMENVKGMLSAQVKNENIFERVHDDLEKPGKANGIDPGLRYAIYPVVLPRGVDQHGLFDDQKGKIGSDSNVYDPRSFIVRSEEHGVPQARHRIILLGIREGTGGPTEYLHRRDRQVPLSDVVSDLPRLRSRRSTEDSLQSWGKVIESGIGAIVNDRWAARINSDLLAALRTELDSLHGIVALGQEEFPKPFWPARANPLKAWYEDSSLRTVLNHEARSHMDGDLVRYFYAAVFAKTFGKSPMGAGDFGHPDLRPAHENWQSGKFADRFRVQIWSSPSTTITSHISKDGHYFIHPDPLQCRSLTVREAARLQTFPDNYRFEGNRTQQYHQVGNAVPPLLAHQIAQLLSETLK